MLVDRFQGHTRNLFFQQFPQKTVANAAAAEQYPGGTLRQMFCQGLAYAASHKMGGGAQYIVQPTLQLSSLLHGLVGEFLAECVQRYGAGRSSLNRRMCKPALQKRLDATALYRVFAARIERFAAAGQQAHESVKQHITRSGMEPKDLTRPRAGRQEYHACQTAQMNKYPGFLSVLKKQVVHDSSQARAQAAGSQITGAEVANDCQAGSFRYNGGHSEAQRRGITAVRFMPGMVSAHARALDLLQVCFCPLGDLSSSGRKRFAEQSMGQADLSRRKGLSGPEFMKQLAQIARISLVHRVPQTQAKLEPDPLGFHERGIDAIACGAGCQTNKCAAGGEHNKMSGVRSPVSGVKKSLA
jgi:hypothetical protein